ncbi:MAG: hypothetical protein ACHQTE_02460 [Candidatus Saccharimonadales bacterium]
MSEYLDTPIDADDQLIERYAAEFVHRRDRQISRRNLLQAGAYGLTLAAMGIESWDTAADVLRDHNKVNIETLHNAETERQFPHTTLLYLPGLKTTWEESATNLKALEPVVSTIGQMASVGYSNKGFDEDEVFHEITSYLQQGNIKKVYLYGGSFSGLVATALTPRLQQLGYDVPAVFCDSSPSGPADVRDQFPFKCLAIAGEYHLPFPEIVRFCAELNERREHKNERSWQQVWDQSVDQLSPSACSSELAMTQAAYTNRFNLSLYTDALGTTQFVYLGNVHDAVVNNPRATRTWPKFLPHNMHTTLYDTGVAYHASPQYGVNIYRRQMANAIHDLHLIPQLKFPVKYT